MSDWLSRAPSVNMIYFLPLKVAAACIFFLFAASCQHEVYHHLSLYPSSLSSLLDPPLFQFLRFIFNSVPVLVAESLRPFIGSVKMELCSDWCSFLLFVHRSGGSGQPPAGCITCTDPTTADTSGAEELSALQAQRLQSAQPLSQLQYGKSEFQIKIRFVSKVLFK